MKTQLAKDLQSILTEYADKYEVIDFIYDDPIEFVHLAYDKKDKEIIGFIASCLAYGNRKAFIPVIRKIYDMMDDDPYSYIMSQEWMIYRDDLNTLYRFTKWHDFYLMCEILHYIYSFYTDFEHFVSRGDHYPIDYLKFEFGHIEQVPDFKSNSSCKKLWMFLRWMIRKNSPVDAGIWSFEQSELMVPVDTHVLKMAQKLQITDRKQADKLACKEITDFAKLIFPVDPARLDFALYGYAINNK